jgi:hypothetical protein
MSGGDHRHQNNAPLSQGSKRLGAYNPSLLVDLVTRAI